MDETAFCQRFVLQRLVDQADLALAWLRGRRWHERWVCEEGSAFPEHGPFLAITFHLGAGLPSMRSLGRHGRGVAFIHAPVEGATRRSDRLGYWLAHARLATVKRLGGAPCIPTGGSAAQAHGWLAQGGGVVALIDAPHQGDRHAVAVPFYGRSIGLPSGLARLAVDAGVPVYVYSVTLAEASPQRLLRIHGPLTSRDPAALTRDIGRLFENTVKIDPAAWSYWGSVDTAFPASDDPSP